MRRYPDFAGRPCGGPSGGPSGLAAHCRRPDRGRATIRPLLPDDSHASTRRWWTSRNEARVSTWLYGDLIAARLHEQRGRVCRRRSRIFAEKKPRAPPEPGRNHLPPGGGRIAALAGDTATAVPRLPALSPHPGRRRAAAPARGAAGASAQLDTLSELRPTASRHTPCLSDPPRRGLLGISSQ